VSLLLLALGCAGAGGGADSAAVDGPLLVAEGWSLAAPADDPWAAEAPADAVCPSTAFGPEGAFFEVETDACGWGTWSQPLGRDVVKGEALAFNFFHLKLWAPEPAEAVVTLHIDGAPVWELRRPVPSEAAVEEVEVAAPAAWAAGATAAFHVHNHGSNSYRLGTIE
jgi:hypothetical protein